MAQLLQNFAIFAAISSLTWALPMIESQLPQMDKTGLLTGCYEKSGLTIKDMKKQFDNADDIPLPYLCAKKCIFEETKLIGEDGKINMVKYTASMEFLLGTKPIIEEVIKCVGEHDKVATCEEAREVTRCELMMFQ